MVLTTVFIFHGTVFADAPATPDNGPALWITIGLAAVIISVVLLITHNNPAEDKDKAVLIEKSSSADAAGAVKSGGTDSSVSVPSDTLEQKLKDLKSLHASGEITDEEYKKMKAKLLLDFK
jgi:hypothetical protein